MESAANQTRTPLGPVGLEHARWSTSTLHRIAGQHGVVHPSHSVHIDAKGRQEEAVGETAQDLRGYVDERSLLRGVVVYTARTAEADKRRGRDRGPKKHHATHRLAFVYEHVITREVDEPYDEIRCPAWGARTGTIRLLMFEHNPLFEMFQPLTYALHEAEDEEKLLCCPLRPLGH